MISGVKTSQGYSAFTLSEVLIVLAIIGIISSITIPSIIANVERNRFDNLIKKSYSTISEALKRTTVNNGNIPIGCYYHKVNPYGSLVCVEYNELGICSRYTLLDGSPRPSDYYGNFDECAKFFEEFKKSLNIVKECAAGMAIADGCIAQYKGNDDVILEKNRLTNSMYSELDAYRATSGCLGWHTSQFVSKEAIVLNNGMTLIPYANSFKSSPALFGIDVNGMQKPNKAGYDLHFFYIKGDSKSVAFYPGVCAYSEQGGKDTDLVLLGK